MTFAFETLAGLAGGLAGWFVVGSTAAWLLTSIGGHREGARAMAGFFVIGPVGGLVGFALAFWLAHRFLERGETAVALPHVALSGLVALAIIVGGGWAILSMGAAVRRPDAPVGLENGEKGAIEFEIHVPEVILRGRPVTDVLSIAFQAMDDRGETVTPVTWREARAHGQATLTGRVLIERRPREQYLVLKQGAEEYSIYARIPANMRKRGPWEDTVYLGRDPATPMGERVSVTSRYLPSGG